MIKMVSDYLMNEILFDSIQRTTHGRVLHGAHSGCYGLESTCGSDFSNSLLFSSARSAFWSLLL